MKFLLPFILCLSAAAHGRVERVITTTSLCARLVAIAQTYPEAPLAVWGELYDAFTRLGVNYLNHTVPDPFDPMHQTPLLYSSRDDDPRGTYYAIAPGSSTVLPQSQLSSQEEAQARLASLQPLFWGGFPEVTVTAITLRGKKAVSQFRADLDRGILQTYTHPQLTSFPPSPWKKGLRSELAGKSIKLGTLASFLLSTPFFYRWIESLSQEGFPGSPIILGAGSLVGITSVASGFVGPRLAKLPGQGIPPDLGGWSHIARLTHFSHGSLFEEPNPKPAIGYASFMVIDPTIRVDFIFTPEFRSRPAAVTLIVMVKEVATLNAIYENLIASQLAQSGGGFISEPFLSYRPDWTGLGWSKLNSFYRASKVVQSGARAALGYSRKFLRQKKGNTLRAVAVGDRVIRLIQDGEELAVVDLNQRKIIWPDGETTPSPSQTDGISHGLDLDEIDLDELLRN